ncbi:hypothetical protein [Thalassiella azotivora]
MPPSAPPPTPPPDLPAHPDPGPPDPPARGDRTTRTGLLLLVAVVGTAGVLLSAHLGRLDSALVFVGLPCAVALAVALLPTRGDGWGTVFQVTTVTLLVASALLHEGALCVLLAAPLVYATVAVVYSAAHASAGGRRDRLAVVPLLGVLALEGVVPGLRVNPEQSSGASELMATSCQRLVERLDGGPRVDPDADRGLLLRVAQYPTPVAVTGTDLRPGGTWTLTMPAGAIRTEVVDRTGSATRGRIDFAVTADDARTTRWVDLRSGSLAWEQTPDGCVAEVTVDYTRRLDPSFWFGPVTDVFMDAGSGAFLRSLT